ncbi:MULTISPECIES: DEAD/DEAH box helicase [Acinetobacter]|nr:DEAD/DEAH box helicase [Acinetobacter pittii]
MMNLPASNYEQSGFELLDRRIQQWIWSEGWSSLRDAQNQAIPALISANQDVIIAAATASGKTEAAFFPILTHLLNEDNNKGVVLYISPLKALINDQWDRLSDLCETLDIPVIGWHGDIAQSKKQKFLKKPHGILLITPESLEALFVNRGTSVAGLFTNLKYIVVDELHAFIGVERGKQLQALMHRAELASQKVVSRVGLSATLGDMSLAAEFLRNKNPERVKIIVSRNQGQTLKVLVKGYINTVSVNEKDDSKSSIDASFQIGSTQAIAKHLYASLRNTSNLIFPNSRQEVEKYSDYLRHLCELDKTPNVFWPHHGNLSKEIREETEKALKDKSRPATAICTTTLELGIDIGAVQSIAQIGSPPSVASLRQRLGRSGRRKGEAAILRNYCIEPEITDKSGFSDCIHEGLLQTIAMIVLLIENWFEPPQAKGLHASTLVQQILSVIAEKGGASANDLWSILVETGPFSNIEKHDFIILLRYLGQKKLITQESSGLLLHGELGEKLVNHYEFYSAFISNEEYRIESNGKSLGSISLKNPLTPNMGLIFAGRRWRVLEINSEAKIIMVMPDKGGAIPYFENTGTAMVHSRIRQRMKEILLHSQEIPFLDATAQKMLAEAREYFRVSNLENTFIREMGGSTLLFTWQGDRVNNTLVLMLGSLGLDASNEGVHICISNSKKSILHATVKKLLSNGIITPAQLLKEVKNLESEKWDWALPKTVLDKSYASVALEIELAMDFLVKVLEETNINKVCN